MFFLVRKVFSQAKVMLIFFRLMTGKVKSVKLNHRNGKKYFKMQQIMTFVELKLFNVSVLQINITA